MPPDLRVAAKRQSTPVTLKKSASRPRKAPSQSRAQQTVEDILTATRKLVIAHGVERLSTNAVARAAGVSIGSLYQYFPGKRALIAELRRRHQQEGEQRMARTAHAMADAPIPVVARTFIEGLIEVHRLDPELHRALELEGREGSPTAFEQRMLALIEWYILRHRDEVCVADTKQAALIVGLTAEAITHQLTVHSPESLADERLIGDVTRMLVAYLTGRVES